MVVLDIGVGVVVGLISGWLVWWLADRFVAGYRSQAPEPAPSDAGAVPLPAALTVVCMALWGALAGWRAPSPAAGVSALVVTAILLCIALVDFQVRRIPNALVVALLVWAAVQLVWLGQPAPLAAVVGLLVAGGLFLVLRVVSRGQMGMGDVKLEAALGALLGFPAIMSAMLLGVIAGGLAAAVLLITRRAGRKDPIAYGPWLALGAWIVLVQAWGLV
ncbi:MAG: A24 family peptidase [Caldilineales bacterium]